MGRVLFFSFVMAVLGCSLSEAQPGADRGQQDPDYHANHDTGHKSGMLLVQTVPAATSAGQPVVLKLTSHDADGTMVREFGIVANLKADVAEAAARKAMIEARLTQR